MLVMIDFVTQYHDQSQLLTVFEKYNIDIPRKSIKVIGCQDSHEDIRWMRLPFVFYVKNDRFYVTQYHDQSQLSRKNIISTFIGNLSK